MTSPAADPRSKAEKEASPLLVIFRRVQPGEDEAKRVSLALAAAYVLARSTHLIEQRLERV
jgi:hypothetical protein